MLLQMVAMQINLYEPLPCVESVNRLLFYFPFRVWLRSPRGEYVILPKQDVANDRKMAKSKEELTKQREQAAVADGARPRRGGSHGDGGRTRVMVNGILRFILC